MPRVTKIAAGIGVFLLVAVGLWLLIAPGQLVKYPTDLDKTAVAKGKLNLFLDSDTAAARSQPRVLPLEIRRRVHVVESSGSQATVQETSAERIGPLPEQTLQQRYVIDRGSLESIKSSDSYAYTPANVTNRAPFYAVNFPFGTDSGPYELWKNEVGSPYTFRRAGPEVERDGVTLIPLVGSLKRAPAIPAYIDQLSGQGVAKALTGDQIARQLEAQGIDVQAVTDQVLPEMTPTQRRLTQALLAQTVPLKYFVSVTTRLLVEPTTGAIVSLDSVDQMLTAAPDLARFARLAELLSKPPLADQPAVQKLSETLTALAETPPLKVLTMTYGQTDASVADFASYAKDKAADVELVKTTIPLILGILAAIALVAAGVLATRDRRRPPAAPADPSKPAEQQPIAHA
jgi:Porin PorA